jgi:hypothetical protein
MAWLPKVHLGVSGGARRPLAWAAVLLIAGLAAFVIAFDQPTDDRSPPVAAPIRPAILVTPSSVLSREPYMGVACNVPNSTRCDRIGLAVWLKRPALTVSGAIDGRALSLRDRSLSTPIHNHRRNDFAGYLAPAGLGAHYHLPAHWLGNPTPHASVRLRIDYGRGPIRETHVRVWLRAGWG